MTINRIFDVQNWFWHIAPPRYKLHNTIFRAFSSNKI